MASYPVDGSAGGPAAWAGVVCATGAMTIVGASFAVSEALVHYPVYTAQAVRYGLSTLVLAGAARVVHRPVPRPTRRELVRLALLAATGLALFNVAVVRSVGHAEPAVLGVVVGMVPLVLAVGGPLARGERPPAAVVAGAGAVVAGAALVQGGGRTDWVGLAWAVVALACEALFTLLAAPMLARLGALGVSVHTCRIATVQLVVLAVVLDGRKALAVPDRWQVLAVAYLVVALTAVAFLLWFTAVARLRPEGAGLFAGIIPVAATAAGLVNGSSTVGPAVVSGVLVVAAGVVGGLAGGRSASAREHGGQIVADLPSPASQRGVVAPPGEPGQVGPQGDGR
ncbi:MAG: DMT family transporter [Acidimicrobiales bacterium]